MTGVSAIVLAAGASSRMGSPKALLRVGDGAPTFVETVVGLLREGGIDEVVIVTRAELGPAVETTVAGRARVVINPAPDRGMQSSIVCGLDALCEPLGVALALVDQPAISPETVRAVVSRFKRDPDRIVVPRAPGGRRGHPVIFPRRLLPALRQSHAEGARAVLWAHPDAILEVETDDPGPFVNTNTPHDLAALRAAQKGKRRGHP